jgi:NAD+ kinase
MKVAIHGRSFRAEAKPYIQKMFDDLAEMSVEVICSKSFFDFISQEQLKIRISQIYHNHKDFPLTDFFISVGGDGTILESVTHIGKYEIPILGINAGRLGFLATTSPANISIALQNLFKGFYSVEDRILVKVESNIELFEGVNFGLNEFTITKRDTSSMIVLHTYINGEYLNSYWADGLIVSTPTGSTGYSLSCGGPVVLPQSNNFIISPISPHNLNVRPMIVSDDSIISFEVEGRSNNFLVSLDSRWQIIEANVQIAVKKQNFVAKLIKFNAENFLDTLRKKLNWGLDVRNY